MGAILGFSILIRMTFQQIDQTYQTSTSEREHGDWNEGFEFRVTYHAQLFDSLQVRMQKKRHVMLLKKPHSLKLMLQNKKKCSWICTTRAFFYGTHMLDAPRSNCHIWKVCQRPLQGKQQQDKARESILSSFLGFSFF